MTANLQNDEKGVGGGNRHPSLTRRQKDRLTGWGESASRPMPEPIALCSFSHLNYILKRLICQIWMLVL
jgi:hypothetical protein